MKRYSVQTGWRETPNNLHPSNPHRFPEHKGNIDIIATNRSVAELCVLVDYVGLSEIIAEISAEGDKNLSKPPTNLMCGSRLLIAN